MRRSASRTVKILERVEKERVPAACRFLLLSYPLEWVRWRRRFAKWASSSKAASVCHPARILSSAMCLCDCRLNPTRLRARGGLRIGTLLAAMTAVLLAPSLHADPVPVRHRQGSAHGFLVLHTLQGSRLATGDATQVVYGDRVVSRLIFRFRDGSIDDDTTVFSQRAPPSTCCAFPN